MIENHSRVGPERGRPPWDGAAAPSRLGWWRRLGLAVLPGVVLAAAAPLRSHVGAADAALVAVGLVALASSPGDRWTPLASATSAAGVFAVAWTVPYGALTVADLGAQVTTLVVFVVGCSVGMLVQRRRPDAGMAAARRLRRAGAGRREGLAALRSVGRLADEVSTAEDADMVVIDVARNLVDVLDLQDCAYELVPTPSALPVLRKSGQLHYGGVTWSPISVGFPTNGFSIAVSPAGQPTGRFVCRPRNRRRVPEGRVVAALAMADQAAAAILISTAR